MAKAAVKTYPQLGAKRLILFQFALLLWTAGIGVSQDTAQSHVLTGDHTWLLEGIITDSTGKPLAGVRVRAEAREGLSAITDGKGKYSLKGTKAARYGVFANKEGYAQTRIRFVQLMPAMRLKLDLKLDREAVLSGKVLNPDGTPIAGVRVNVWMREIRDGRPLFDFRGGAQTDDDGQYQIRGLSGGAYFVAGVPKGIEAKKYYSPDPRQQRKHELTYPPIFSPGVQSIEDAHPIHLHKSELRDGVDLILQTVPTFCAIGTLDFGILSKGSEEAALILTEVTQGWSIIVGGGHVQHGQMFQICDLVPGIHYSLTAQLWGDGMKAIGFAERDFEGNKVDVELERPLNLGVLSIRSGEPVKGQIILDPNQHDKAIPTSISVVLENTTGLPGYINETRVAQALETGEFVLPNVFPYNHSLRILNLPSGYYVKQAVCDHYDLLQEPWRPGCGDLHIIVGVDAATITGQAVDEKGQPITDADVILVPKGPDAKIAVRPVDQGGYFQFSSVIPGAYNIIALTGIPEGEAQDPGVVRNYLSHSTDLNLASRGRQSLILTVQNVE